MSVRTDERNDNILRSETVTIELVKYLIQICEGNKIFPNNVKWSICDKIVQNCIELITHIRNANEIRVVTIQQAERRELHQIKAIEHLITIKTLLDLAVECYHVPVKTIQNYAKLYNNAIKHIKGWHKSDVNKHNKMFNRNYSSKFMGTDTSLIKVNKNNSNNNSTMLYASSNNKFKETPIVKDDYDGVYKHIPKSVKDVLIRTQQKKKNTKEENNNVIPNNNSNNIANNTDISNNLSNENNLTNASLKRKGLF